MGIGLVADEGSLFITKEVTEGTYVAETSGAQALEILSDGLELNPARELLPRENRTSTVETVASRLGTKSVAGTVPFEWRAGNAEGDAPEGDLLYESLLGGKRQGTTENTTKVAGNTDQILQIEDADIGDYAVGDIILVKEAGGFEVNPITAVDPSGGTANITLLRARGAGAYTDSVKIGKFTTYFHDSSNADSLSLTRYLGGKIRQKGIGVRPTSMELTNFATGQLASIAMGVEGLTYDREVGTPLFTPEFDTSPPPVILQACIFRDGIQLDLNAFGLSLTNTLGFLTSTCSVNGRISSRITKQETGGSLNPYMEDDDVDTWDFFNDGSAFSLFGFAFNPTAVAGEFEQICAFYVPNCRSPELAVGEEDGILTDGITYTGHKTLGSDQTFLSFI